MPHDLFTELDELSFRDGSATEWRETARSECAWTANTLNLLRCFIKNLQLHWQGIVQITEVWFNGFVYCSCLKTKSVFTIYRSKNLVVTHLEVMKFNIIYCLWVLNCDLSCLFEIFWSVSRQIWSVRLVLYLLFCVFGLYESEKCILWLKFIHCVLFSGFL